MKTPRSLESIRFAAVRSSGCFLSPICCKVHLACPWRKIIEGVNNVFKKSEIRATLSDWINQAQSARQLEEAAAHEQIWNEITALLDQMVDLLGDEAVTPAEFTDILETGLERFDLAITPPTVDQILVGAIDRTRTPSLKAIILIGWHDGGFPLRPPPPPLFPTTTASK